MPGPVRGVAGLLALISTLLLCQGLALGASKISGQVTGPDGAPLANVCVEAQAPILGGVSNRSAETGPDGKYTITDLFTYDDYRIYFRNCGGGNYAPEYYSNSPDLSGAEPVSAAVDNAVTTNINAQLEAGASITGQVTSGAAGIGGVCVEALDSGGVISSATSAADGSYEVKNLPAGSVKVRFAGCPNYDGVYVGEYWNDTRDPDLATLVPVTPGTPYAGVNAELPIEGEITGRVSALVGGQDLAGICVEAIDAGGQPTGDPGVETATDGNYRIGGLPAGTFTVRFSDCGTGGGAYLEQTSAEIAVTSGGTSGPVDAQLSRAATVAGTVTAEAGGAPVEGVCIGLYDSSDVIQGTTSTAADGTYVLDRILPGSYKIGFLTTGAGSCAPVDYLTEFYDGAPAAPDAIDLAGAAAQTLSADQSLTGVDAALSRGGAITGTVADLSDLGIANVCVEAYDDAGEVVSFDETDGDGIYRIEALRDGDYRVGFRDCDTGLYLNEFHDGAGGTTLLENAVPVAVAAADPATEVNAQLAYAGAIRGTVIDAAGDALPGICVTVTDPGGGFVDEVMTDGDGIYLVRSLPTDDYTVFFDECAGDVYRGEYFDDVTSLLDAEPVPVTPANTSLADATLARGGSITGRVTNAASAPLEDICVRASDPGGSSVVALSGADGRYSVDGLAGDYTLRFSDCSGQGYLTEYWDNQPTVATATTVSVVDNEVTAGRDAVLALGGSITGKVTSGGGTPQDLAGICVDATSDGGAVTTAVTAADGTYAVRGLLSGDYDVHFSDCEAGVYHEADFDSDTLTPEIDPVAVVVGSATPNVDAQLSVSGSISGRVTNELAGQPLEGVCVDAYDSTDSVVSNATTDADGNYVVRQLVSGDHRLRFRPCAATEYIGQYYDDVATLGEATPITVVDGEDSFGNNAVLRSTDTVAPETSITDGPSGTIGLASAEFEFGSSEAGSTFECKLDGPGGPGDFTACAAPSSQGYTSLAEGDYVFSVVAIDPVGNRDPVADTRAFAVDLTGPQASISGGPSGLTNDDSPSFGLGSDESGSTFECKLEGPGLLAPTFEPCFSADYTGLADGSHTFSLRAIDAVGNAGSPVDRSFTVDTAAPDTSVSGPSGIVEDGRAAFQISGSDGAASYQCRLQGPGRFEGFAPCNSSKSYSGLADGQWTFEARAVDAAGNLDPSVASWDFTTRTVTDPGPGPGPDPVDPKDVEPPETSFSRTPKKTIKSKKKTVKAAFFFSASEAAGFECSLDGSDFSPCTSPFKTKVKKGKHRFAVRAVDEADNVDSSPAEFAFKVKVKKKKKKKR